MLHHLPAKYHALYHHTWDLWEHLFILAFQRAGNSSRVYRPSRLRVTPDSHAQLTPRCFGFGFTSIYTIVQIYSTKNAEAKQRSHRSIWDTAAALHVVQRLSCINIHPKQQSAQANFIFHTRSKSHFGKRIINFSTRTRYILQSQTAFSNWVHQCADKMTANILGQTQLCQRYISYLMCILYKSLCRKDRITSVTLI